MALVLGVVGDTHCIEGGDCDDECIACAAAVPTVVIAHEVTLTPLAGAPRVAAPRMVYAETTVTTPPPRA